MPYRADGQLDAVALDEDDEDVGVRRIYGKVPPPVEGPAGPGGARAGPLSQPIEQAAYPTFDIIVGDPHKVGDLTSAHIVYSVRTKVSTPQHRDQDWQLSYNIDIYVRR